jgi:hypothetical protein
LRLFLHEPNKNCDQSLNKTGKIKLKLFHQDQTVYGKTADYARVCTT